MIPSLTIDQKKAKLKEMLHAYRDLQLQTDEGLIRRDSAQVLILEAQLGMSKCLGIEIKKVLPDYLGQIHTTAKEELNDTEPGAEVNKERSNAIIETLIEKFFGLEPSSSYVPDRVKNSKIFTGRSTTSIHDQTIRSEMPEVMSVGLVGSTPLEKLMNAALGYSIYMTEGIMWDFLGEGYRCLEDSFGETQLLQEIAKYALNEEDFTFGSVTREEKRVYLREIISVLEAKLESMREDDRVAWRQSILDKMKAEFDRRNTKRGTRKSIESKEIRPRRQSAVLDNSILRAVVQESHDQDRRSGKSDPKHKRRMQINPTLLARDVDLCSWYAAQFFEEDRAPEDFVVRTSEVPVESLESKPSAAVARGKKTRDSNPSAVKTAEIEAQTPARRMSVMSSGAAAVEESSLKPAPEKTSVAVGKLATADVPRASRIIETPLSEESKVNCKLYMQDLTTHKIKFPKNILDKSEWKKNIVYIYTEKTPQNNKILKYYILGEFSDVPLEGKIKDPIISQFFIRNQEEISKLSPTHPQVVKCLNHVLNEIPQKHGFYLIRNKLNTLKIRIQSITTIHRLKDILLSDIEEALRQCEAYYILLDAINNGTSRDSNEEKTLQLGKIRRWIFGINEAFHGKYELKKKADSRSDSVISTSELDDAQINKYVQLISRANKDAGLRGLFEPVEEAAVAAPPKPIKRVRKIFGPWELPNSFELNPSELGDVARRCEVSRENTHLAPFSPTGYLPAMTAAFSIHTLSKSFDAYSALNISAEEIRERLIEYLENLLEDVKSGEEESLTDSNAIMQIISESARIESLKQRANLQIGEDDFEKFIKQYIDDCKERKTNEVRYPVNKHELKVFAYAMGFQVYFWKEIDLHGHKFITCETEQSRFSRPRCDFLVPPKEPSKDRNVKSFKAIKFNYDQSDVGNAHELFKKELAKTRIKTQTESGELVSVHCIPAVGTSLAWIEALTNVKVFSPQEDAERIKNRTQLINAWNTLCQTAGLEGFLLVKDPAERSKRGAAVNFYETTFTLLQSYRSLSPENKRKLMSSVNPDDGSYRAVDYINRFLQLARLHGEGNYKSKSLGDNKLLQGELLLGNDKVLRRDIEKITMGLGLDPEGDKSEEGAIQFWHSGDPSVPDREQIRKIAANQTLAQMLVDCLRAVCPYRSDTAEAFAQRVDDFSIKMMQLNPRHHLRSENLSPNSVEYFFNAEIQRWKAEVANEIRLREDEELTAKAAEEERYKQLDEKIKIYIKNLTAWQADARDPKNNLRRRIAVVEGNLAAAEETCIELDITLMNDEHSERIPAARDRVKDLKKTLDFFDGDNVDKGIKRLREKKISDTSISKENTEAFFQQWDAWVKKVEVAKSTLETNFPQVETEAQAILTEAQRQKEEAEAIAAAKDTTLQEERKAMLDSLTDLLIKLNDAHKKIITRAKVDETDLKSYIHKCNNLDPRVLSTVSNLDEKVDYRGVLITRRELFARHLESFLGTLNQINSDISKKLSEASEIVEKRVEILASISFLKDQALQFQKSIEQQIEVFSNQARTLGMTENAIEQETEALQGFIQKPQVLIEFARVEESKPEVSGAESVKDTTAEVLKRLSTIQVTMMGYTNQIAGMKVPVAREANRLIQVFKSYEQAKLKQEADIAKMGELEVALEGRAARLDESATGLEAAVKRATASGVKEKIEFWNGLAGKSRSQSVLLRMHAEKVRGARRELETDSAVVNTATLKPLFDEAQAQSAIRDADRIIEETSRETSKVEVAIDNEEAERVAALERERLAAAEREKLLAAIHLASMTKARSLCSDIKDNLTGLKKRVDSASNSIQTQTTRFLAKKAEAQSCRMEGHFDGSGVEEELDRLSGRVSEHSAEIERIKVALPDDEADVDVRLESLAALANKTNALETQVTETEEKLGVVTGNITSMIEIFDSARLAFEEKEASIALVLTAGLGKREALIKKKSDDNAKVEAERERERQEALARERVEKASEISKRRDDNAAYLNNLMDRVSDIQARIGSQHALFERKKKEAESCEMGPIFSDEATVLLESASAELASISKQLDGLEKQNLAITTDGDFEEMLERTEAIRAAIESNDVNLQSVSSSVEEVAEKINQMIADFERAQQAVIEKFTQEAQATERELETLIANLNDSTSALETTLGNAIAGVRADSNQVAFWEGLIKKYKAQSESLNNKLARHRTDITRVVGILSEAAVSTTAVSESFSAMQQIKFESIEADMEEARAFIAKTSEQTQLTQTEIDAREQSRIAKLEAEADAEERARAAEKARQAALDSFNSAAGGVNSATGRTQREEEIDEVIGALQTGKAMLTGCIEDLLPSEQKTPTRAELSRVGVSSRIAAIEALEAARLEREAEAEILLQHQRNIAKARKALMKKRGESSETDPESTEAPVDFTAVGKAIADARNSADNTSQRINEILRPLIQPAGVSIEDGEDESIDARSLMSDFDASDLDDFDAGKSIEDIVAELDAELAEFDEAMTSPPLDFSEMDNEETDEDVMPYTCSLRIDILKIELASLKKSRALLASSLSKHIEAAEDFDEDESFGDKKSVDFSVLFDEVERMESEIAEEQNKLQKELEIVQANDHGFILNSSEQAAVDEIMQAVDKRLDIVSQHVDVMTEKLERIEQEKLEAVEEAKSNRAKRIRDKFNELYLDLQRVIDDTQNTDAEIPEYLEKASSLLTKLADADVDADEKFRVFLAHWNARVNKSVQALAVYQEQGVLGSLNAMVDSFSLSSMLANTDEENRELTDRVNECVDAAYACLERIDDLEDVDAFHDACDEHWLVREVKNKANALRDRIISTLDEELLSEEAFESFKDAYQSLLGRTDQVRSAIQDAELEIHHDDRDIESLTLEMVENWIVDWHKEITDISSALDEVDEKVQAKKIALEQAEKIARLQAIIAKLQEQLERSAEYTDNLQRQLEEQRRSVEWSSMGAAMMPRIMPIDMSIEVEYRSLVAAAVAVSDAETHSVALRTEIDDLKDRLAAAGAELDEVRASPRPDDAALEALKLQVAELSMHLFESDARGSELQARIGEREDDIVRLTREREEALERARVFDEELGRERFAKAEALAEERRLKDLADAALAHAAAEAAEAAGIAAEALAERAAAAAILRAELEAVGLRAAEEERARLAAEAERDRIRAEAEEAARAAEALAAEVRAREDVAAARILELEARLADAVARAAEADRIRDEERERAAEAERLRLEAEARAAEERRLRLEAEARANAERLARVAAEDRARLAEAAQRAAENRALLAERERDRAIAEQERLRLALAALEAQRRAEAEAAAIAAEEARLREEDLKAQNAVLEKEKTRLEKIIAGFQNMFRIKQGLTVAAGLNDDPVDADEAKELLLKLSLWELEGKLTERGMIRNLDKALGSGGKKFMKWSTLEKRLPSAIVDSMRKDWLRKMSQKLSIDSTEGVLGLKEISEEVKSFYSNIDDTQTLLDDTALLVDKAKSIFASKNCPQDLRVNYEAKCADQITKWDNANRAWKHRYGIMSKEITENRDKNKRLDNVARKDSLLKDLLMEVESWKEITKDSPDDTLANWAKRVNLQAVLLQDFGITIHFDAHKDELYEMDRKSFNRKDPAVFRKLTEQVVHEVEERIATCITADLAKEIYPVFPLAEDKIRVRPIHLPNYPTKIIAYAASTDTDVRFVPYCVDGIDENDPVVQKAIKQAKAQLSLELMLSILYRYVDKSGSWPPTADNPVYIYPSDPESLQHLAGALLSLGVPYEAIKVDLKDAKGINLKCHYVERPEYSFSLEHSHIKAVIHDRVKEDTLINWNSKTVRKFVEDFSGGRNKNPNKEDSLKDKRKELNQFVKDKKDFMHGGVGALKKAAVESKKAVYTPNSPRENKIPGH